MAFIRLYTGNINADVGTSIDMPIKANKKVFPLNSNLANTYADMLNMISPKKIQKTVIINVFQKYVPNGEYLNAMI